ncbi:MAG: GtrA family protein [Chloroflexota bacterium]
MVAIFTNVANRFFGINPKEAERFFKFAVVGAIGFVVDFGVLNLLLQPFANALSTGGWLNTAVSSISNNPPSLAEEFAGTISFICAILSNFLFNRFYTYPDSREKGLVSQFIQFSLVSVAGIVIRIPILLLTTTFFQNMISRIASLEPFAFRLGANLALVLAVIIVMFWNFFVNRYWTYNDVSSEP